MALQNAPVNKGRRAGRIALAVAGLGLGFGLLVPASGANAAETTAATSSVSQVQASSEVMTLTNNTSETITYTSNSGTAYTIAAGQSTVVTGDGTLTYSNGTSAVVDLYYESTDRFWELEIDASNGGREVTSDDWGMNASASNPNTETFKLGGHQYIANYYGGSTFSLQIS